MALWNFANITLIYNAIIVNVDCPTCIIDAAARYVILINITIKTTICVCAVILLVKLITKVPYANRT